MNGYFKKEKFESHQRGAGEALSSLDDEKYRDEAIALIKNLVKSQDYYIRSKALASLEHFFSTDRKEFFPIIEMLAKDQDEYVRGSVAVILKEIVKFEPERGIDLLQRLATDSDAFVRKATVESLSSVAELKPTEVLRVLQTLIGDGDTKVRKEVATALGNLTKNVLDDTFELLRKLAKDDDFGVREEAASSIETFLAHYPKRCLTVISYLIKDNSIAVLPFISKFARNEIIEEIAKIYIDLIESKDKASLESNLEKGIRFLDKNRDLENSKETYLLFNIYLQLLKTITTEEIVVTRPKLVEIIKFENKIEPNLVEVLNRIHTIVEILSKYERVDNLKDKLSYLSEASTHIDATEKLADRNLLSLEKEILIQILSNWRTIISHAISGLKGRAKLEILLRTKEILRRDEITLLLSVRNVGESLAEDIEVELLPSKSFDLIDKTKTINMLVYNKTDSIEFRIKPKEENEFRVEFNLKYSDFEKKGKTMPFADRVSLVQIEREFKYIPNPYIIGAPIKSESKEMFVGREDVFKFIKENISSLAQKNVLILQGERRTGKTSILYQLPPRLGNEYVPVFLDGQEFGRATLDYFFYRLAREIAIACKTQGINIPQLPRDKFKDEPMVTFKDEFLEQVRSKIRDKNIVIMFDEFEALESAISEGTMDKAVLPYLRHLMQHEDKMAFIFAGMHTIEEMMSDYWNVLFNLALYKKISFLDEASAKDLIIRPVKDYNMVYDELAIEKILKVTACHPYFLQLICRFLVNLHNDEKRNYITIQDVNKEIENVVEKSKPHFDYMWALSSLEEKLVLVILSKIIDLEGVATVSSIMTRLNELNIKINSEEVRKTLDKLLRRELVKEEINETSRYDFRFQLIKLWIDKYQSEGKVVRSYQESRGVKLTN